MSKEWKIIWVLSIAVAFMAGAFTLPGLIGAGDLDPGVPPAPTMKTLDEIPPTWSQKIDDASERFVLVLDGGAVLDKETGLVWEQSPEITTRNWRYACDYCYDREIDGRKGWRLPTIEELASLVHDTPQGPALPSGHPFDDVQTSYYWSSTTWAEHADFARIVNISYGSVTFDQKSFNFYVWCVRGGSGHDGW